MSAPFNFGQLKFLKALTEALFHGAPMVISADQVVANAPATEDHFFLVPKVVE